MKNILFVIITILSVQDLNAQIKIGGETTPTYEYATVNIRVLFQNNAILYNESGYNNSPVMFMPNGDSFILKNSTLKPTENQFKNVNELMNYLSNEGWRLISSTVIQNKFDTQNEPLIFQLRTYDEMYQQLIFERLKN